MRAVLRPRTAVLTAALALALPAGADAAMVFPDGDVVREGLGDSGATVSWRTPTVTSGSLRGTPNCTPASGSAFPTGTTEVECRATINVCDPGPPVGLCIIQPIGGRFDVTVTPGAGPQITGLSDRAAEAEPGRESATVDYPLPSAADPSGIAPGSVTCAPASGSEFRVGDTTVSCRARDTVGNDSTASFRVSVVPAAVAPGAPAPGAPVGPAAPSAPTVDAPRAALPVALGARLRIARGTARVAVACRAANPVPCKGVLALRIGRTVVGRKRFTLAPGRRTTLRVRLSRAALRKLARRRPLRLRATAVTNDAAGRPLTGTRTFRVRAPRR
jgi:hypothetical protein